MKIPILQAVLSLLATMALLAPVASGAQGLTPHEVRSRAIFQHIIGIKTSVGMGQVPVMAEYLANEFGAAGFPSADIHVLPLGETASMVVRYRGSGSGGKPILLLAHMDVVTAKPEEWRRDPFELVEENGYFFGRGTSDVKNGVTSLTATFLRLKAEGFVPTRDLVIVFTGDEEISQDTTQDLLRNHRDLLAADFALNSDAGGGTLDETTGQAIYYSIGTAEKAYASYELTVRNPGGHSSRPRADNAIYELADALLKVRAYRFPVMWSETTLGYFKAVGSLTPGKPGSAMRKFATDPRDGATAAVLSDSPMNVGMIRTTCVPTLLRGGHADNALPQTATATVNCRIFPGVDPAAVSDRLKQLVGRNVEVTTIGTPAWSDASPLRADVLSAVAQAVHQRHPGIPVVPKQDSGASDNLFFRAAGIPAYGVSEAFLKDSDDYAHGLDERLPVRSFYDGLEYWYVLLRGLAGPGR